MTPQGTSPLFVGRDAELGVLLDHARAARTEGSAMLLLSGDAGVGKSRLLAEYAARTGNTRVLAGGCLELGVEGLPFAPFVAVLRQLLRESGRDLFDALAADGEQELARLLPELGQAPGDRYEARGRLFEQVLRALQETAEPDGLTVIIEDLHWADSATRDLLVFLVRNLDTPGVQLLVSYRADDIHRGHQLRRLLPELERLPTVAQLELTPLSREDAALQAAAIRGAELHPDEVDALYGRSAGNPLFVESLAAHTQLIGSLVPDRPRELLLSSLERLGDTERSIVKAAAVGAVSSDHIEHEMLAHVIDLPDHELDAALLAIVDSNVLRVEGTGYRFRHSLLREAVHQDLLPGQHARLHLRYAEALDTRPELVPADRIASEQAHHFHAAHELPRALSAAWWAAVRAGEALAFAEELRMAERVIELWDRVPDSARRVEGVSLAEVLYRAAGAAHDSGDPARAKELCDAGLAEFPADTAETAGTAGEPSPSPADGSAHDDAVLRALHLRLRGRSRIQLADDDGIDDYWAALDVHPIDNWRYGFLLAIIARELMMRGGTVPAGKLSPQALGDDPANTAAAPADERAITVADLARAALRHAAASGDRCAEADAHITLGTLYGNDGRFDAAVAAFGEGVDIARAAHEPALELRGISNKSAFLREIGRLDEAVDAADLGLARAHQSNLHRTMSTFVMLNKAEALRDRGELAAARDAVANGLSWAKPPLWRSFMHVVDGTIALAQGDLATAETVLGHIRHLGTLRFAHLQHAICSATFAIDAHRVFGDTASAIDIARSVSDASFEAGSALSYGWPLLQSAAQALHAHRAAEGFDAAADLHDRISALVDRIPVHCAVQGAWRSSVRATLLNAEAAPADDAHAAWGAAVQEWAATGLSLQRADAQLGAAAAAAAAGDRHSAAPLLRAAAHAAKESGAEPLERRVTDLARRTGIALDATPASAPPGPPAGLTPRETEVLRLLSRGRTNAEIAGELFISAKTASVHVSNILGKLGLANRGAAAAHARELGLD
ncbi:regulatory LuxR family protein [Murinocardiopsis flavida]|uniref:Regulatory LuxR family protein n=1 Tax=Murinocardiopsis flavida TaxID=645275 RepID=A0A2P8CZY0_9ACTN|nr:LuxR family transcriptional regulator [Murinocardiopsis flavida]PSK90523.1 regulatory LuxR family protein [Murinocardiopsis flavida]